MGFKIKWRPKPVPPFKVGDWVTLKSGKWTSAFDRSKLVAYQVSQVATHPGASVVYIGRISTWVSIDSLRLATDDRDVIKGM